MSPRQEIVRAGAAGNEWYEVRTAPLPAARSARAGRVLLLRNISDARRSRQQLEESETLYRNVVERQGEGIAILDDSGVFVYANPAAAIILGTTPGALVGRSLFEFLTAAQLQAYRQEQEQRRSRRHCDLRAGGDAPGRRRAHPVDDNRAQSPGCAVGAAGHLPRHHRGADGRTAQPAVASAL
jgi:PAS domain S-box-containing protein